MAAIPMPDDIHPRWPGITLDTLRAALAREADHRRTAYPRMIEARRMTAAEADHQQAIIAALIADVDLMAIKAPSNTARHGHSWRVRRDAIARELDYRRRLYPRWIPTGRITQAEADHGIAAFECLLYLFDQGWDWTASNGAWLAFGGTAPVSEAVRAAREEWRAHVATTFAEDGSWHGGLTQQADTRQHALL
jgi:hypothetical protein